MTIDTQDEPKSIGNGVKMSGTVTDYTDGTITLTGGKTQAALEGNGFFVVGDSKGGNMEFTRKGHLQYLQIIILRIQKVNMYLLIQLIHQLVMLIYLVFRTIANSMGSAIGGIRTSQGIVGGNIPADAKQITQELPAYDDAGNTWTMRVEFTQDGEHNYKYTVKMRNESKKETEFTEIQGAGGNVKFNEVGSQIR